jgi:hypothetical protein
MLRVMETCTVKAATSRKVAALLRTNGAVNMTMLCDLGIDPFNATVIIEYVNSVRRNPPQHCPVCGDLVASGTWEPRTVT